MREKFLALKREREKRRHRTFTKEWKLLQIRVGVFEFLFFVFKFYYKGVNVYKCVGLKYKLKIIDDILNDVKTWNVLKKNNKIDFISFLSSLLWAFKNNNNIISTWNKKIFKFSKNLEGEKKNVDLKLCRKNDFWKIK